MAVKELLQIVKRHLKLCISLFLVLVILFLVIFFVSQFAGDSESLDEDARATSYIVANSQVAGVAGIATSDARQIVGGDEDYSAFVSVDGVSTVNITVTGPSEVKCILIANKIARLAAGKADKFYEGMENPYRGYVEEATKRLADAEKIEMEDASETRAELKKIAYFIIGIMGCLFLAITVTVVLDNSKNPIRNASTLTKVFKAPLLGTDQPQSDGTQVFENLSYALDDRKAESVCIISISDDGSSEVVARHLSNSLNKKKEKYPSFIIGGSLDTGMDAIQLARSSDATIVTARLWENSMTQAQRLVDELALARVNPIGIILVEE